MPSSLFTYLKYFCYIAWNWNIVIAIYIIYHEIKGEKKYGIDTIGINNLDELDSKHLDNATIYMPAVYPMLEMIFEKVNVKKLHHLLDIGCGKGRAICVAVERARQLRLTFPNYAHKILHVPHSAPEWTIPDQPFYEPGPLPVEIKDVPQPILGYLGGLEDRLDWNLLIKIADRFPDVSLVLVGPKPGLDGDHDWQLQARELLAERLRSWRRKPAQDRRRLRIFQRKPDPLSRHSPVQSRLLSNQNS